MPENNSSHYSAESAIPENNYRGRFAPSPTGPLHFGSLVAAVASFLDARSAKGAWLVRMEDLDPPREVPGAADEILRALVNHGLLWDGSVLYQSQRHNAYLEVLQQLKQQKYIYQCVCSRKTITEQQKSLGISVYPGTCRNRESVRKAYQRHAIRLKTGKQEIGFEDGIQGYYSQHLQYSVGDFVLKRSDGLFAYQLAVVVDDESQGISAIVRGSDLLDNTPRQIYLQRLLGFKQPTYAHLPVAANNNGEKLSKQTMAQPINNASPSSNLIKALEFLGQNPPGELSGYQPDDILNWAISHWQLHEVPKTLKIIVDN